MARARTSSRRSRPAARGGRTSARGSSGGNVAKYALPIAAAAAVAWFFWPQRAYAGQPGGSGGAGGAGGGGGGSGGGGTIPIDPTPIDPGPPNGGGGAGGDPIGPRPPPWPATISQATVTGTQPDSGLFAREAPNSSAPLVPGGGDVTTPGTRDPDKTRAPWYGKTVAVLSTGHRGTGADEWWRIITPGGHEAYVAARIGGKTMLAHVAGTAPIPAATLVAPRTSPPGAQRTSFSPGASRPGTPPGLVTSPSGFGWRDAPPGLVAQYAYPNGRR